MKSHLLEFRKYLCPKNPSKICLPSTVLLQVRYCTYICFLFCSPEVSYPFLFSECPQSLPVQSSFTDQEKSQLTSLYWRIKKGKNLKNVIYGITNKKKFNARKESATFLKKSWRMTRDLKAQLCFDVAFFALCILYSDRAYTLVFP